MTKKEQKQIRERLMAKLAELAAGLRRHELVSDWSNEPMDQVQYRAELDMAAQFFNTDFQTQRAVERALRLLDQGEYGMCQECEEPINEKRLQAIPWTTMCVHCQEEFDNSAPDDKKLKRAA